MDRRFYCPEIPDENQLTSLPDDESHHFITVLRGRVGETIVLLDGQGTLASAEVVEIRRRQPVVCKITRRERAKPPTVKFHLFVAPSRGKGMAGIIRSATEMGVRQITPIICARATSKPDAAALSTWEAAAITGIKQAINPFCPIIDPPSPLEDILEGEMSPGYIGWVPESQPDGQPHRIEADTIALFIGPEGGFTESEAASIVNQGIQPVSFGPYVLRVETAVVAGLSWLNQMYRLP